MTVHSLKQTHLQKYFISFLLGGFLVAGIALANHGEETGVDALDPAETVTAADLGVEDPGTLPTSRLYFFKEWGRGIRSFFIFDSVKKAELELHFANEKAAEAKKIQELRVQDPDAVIKALENYEKAQVRLTVRFEALRETSQNPNVDKLLDKVVERTIQHEKLFDGIAKKLKQYPSAQEKVEKLKEKIEESTASASQKDDAAKFAARLEKAFIESPGSELEHIRSIEILDRIQEKTTGDIRKSLQKVREDFSARVLKDILEIESRDGQDALRESLQSLPGDIVRRTAIFEELRERIRQRGGVFVSETLKKTSDALEGSVKERVDIVQKADEQIRRAQERIKEFEAKGKEPSLTPDNAEERLAKAKEYLAKALEVREEGKHGEAFGQGKSAEVQARHALRLLEEVEETQGEPEELENRFGKVLRELDERIRKYEELIRSKGFLHTQNPEPFGLRDAKTLLQSAEDAFAKKNFYVANAYANNVRDSLRAMGERIEEKGRASNKER